MNRGQSAASSSSGSPSGSIASGRCGGQQSRQPAELFLNGVRSRHRVPRSGFLQAVAPGVRGVATGDCHAVSDEGHDALGVSERKFDGVSVVKREQYLTARQGRCFKEGHAPSVHDNVVMLKRTYELNRGMREQRVVVGNRFGHRGNCTRPLGEGATERSAPSLRSR